MSASLPSEFVAILDVGHGNATVISTRTGNVVVDTGAGTALHEFLKQAGITKIDTLVLSHADQDHIGAVQGLVSSNQFTIDRIFLNTDSLKETDVWKDLLYELHTAEASGKIIQFNAALTKGSPSTIEPCGVTIEVCAPCSYLAALGPGSKTKDRRPITSNTISAVLRISKAKSPVVLLLGDIDGTGLAYLEKSGVDVRSPVIVFPHHGGLPGGVNPMRFTRKLMNMTKPSVVVFSVGRNHFGNPQPKITSAIKRLHSHCRVLCTQLSSTCCPKPPASPKASHLSCAYAAGREAGITCGGTIILDLSSTNKLAPCSRGHRTFIKDSVPTPLCFAKTTPRHNRSASRPRSP